MKAKTKEEMVGLEGFNNAGLHMIIVEYNGSKNIVVQFDDGTTFRTTTSAFYKGSIKNLNHRDVLGVACIGVGEYTPSKHKVCYDKWLSMLTRCYSTDRTDYHNYDNCSVSDEWLVFQNFAKWFYSQENYQKVINNKREFALDKDIKHKGNRIYSKENCLLVSKIVNNVIVKRDKSRGECPLGVYWETSRQKYVAKLNKFGKNIWIGRYDSLMEAFYAYKKAKEAYIKEVAWTEYLKGNITEECCRALHLYPIEITD